MKSIKNKWKEINYLKSIEKELQAIANKQPIIEDSDLSGIVIGPLSTIDILKKNYLYQSTLVRVNLSYSNIAGSISESNLLEVNFEKSNLNRCTMFKSNIKHSNFSMAKIIASLDDAIFENCNFKDAKIMGGTYGYEYGGRRTTFCNCDFTNAVFKNVEFRASKFIHCNFTNTKFIQCDLRGMKIEGEINLNPSQFESMELPDALKSV